MGISVANVVNDHDSLKDILTKIRKGYRGWNVADAGVLAEKYIAGREFTVLLVGTYTYRTLLQFIPPSSGYFISRYGNWEVFVVR